MRPFRFRLLVGLVGVLLLTGAGWSQTATPPAATNFGTQTVGVASMPVAVTFTIGTGGALSSTTPAVVLTQGSANQDFKLGTGSTCTGTVSASSTCTVYVVFTPKASMLRTGAVELTNSSGAVIATALLYGLGQGAVAHFTPGIINTVAGDATKGYNGDGAATSTELNTVQFIVADGAGNMYFSDQSNNRVRYYNATANTITTIVGTGNSSPYNDDVAGTSANISPVGLAIDGAGNLYIVDSANSRIRKYNPTTQILTTIIGSGTSTYSTQSSVAALSANIAPYGVAVDVSGNVYFTEYVNNVVRVLTLSTGNVTPVAGNGTAGYTGEGSPATNYEINEPAGIAVGLDGNLYISEFSGERIRKVTIPGGVISTVIGNGNGSTSVVLKPNGIKFDAEGDLYFANQGYNVISKIPDTSQVLTNIAGNGGSTGFGGDGGVATSAKLWQANDMALDNSGNLYISDQFNNRIREVTYAPPASIAFGTINTGTSSTQTETIENDGNANLTFSSISISGGSYLTTGGTCSTSMPVAPGASCTVSVTFSPTAATIADTTLTIADNSLTSPHAIAVSGSTPNNPQTITFNMSNTAIAGSSATLSATSSSGGTVTFSVFSGAATISGSTVTYPSMGTVVLQASQAGNSTYAAATAKFTVTVGSGINVGTSATLTQTMTIAVAGKVGSITGYSRGVANEDYTVVSGGSCAVGTTYSAGGSCTVKYTFTPQHPWSRPGGIVIGDTSGNIMSAAYLSEVGNGPQTVISPSTGAPLLQLTNGYTTALAVSDNGITGTDGNYGESNDPIGNIYYGGNGNGSNASIYMTPVTGGATVTVLNDANCGEGIPLALAVNPTNGYLYFSTAGYSSGFTFDIAPAAGNVVSSTTNCAGVNEVQNNGYYTAMGLAFDSAGNLYENIAQYEGYGAAQVGTKILKNGNQIGGPYADGGQYQGLTLNPEGDLYFLTYGAYIYLAPASMFAQGATFSPNVWNQYGSGGPSASSSIHAMASDSWGNIYFAHSSGVFEYDFKDPPSLSWTYTTVGTDATAGSQEVTVTNNGNTTLTISSIVAPTDFKVSGGTCGAGTTLTASSTQSCTIDVIFHPLSSGSKSELVTVYDNSLQGSHTISVAGLGVPSVTSVSPNTGFTTGGSSVTITGAGFTGTSSIQFGSGNYSPSFTVNSDTSITAVTPAVSASTVDVYVDSNGYTQYTSTADQFTFIPFTQNVGSASSTLTATLTVTNATGNAAVIPSASNVLTLGAPNLDFKFVSTTCTATAYMIGQTCMVSYTFTPLHPGLRMGAITLVDGSGNTLATTFVHGVGTGPQAYFPGNTSIISIAGGTNAQPYGVAVDGAGDVFYADTKFSVREIAATNGTISLSSASTILSSVFSQPYGVAVDGAGDVFVSSFNTNAVYEIAATNGVVSPSSAVNQIGTTNGNFNQPYGLAVDGFGNVFVADSGNSAVKEIVAVNGVVSGSSTVNTVGSTNGHFSGPQGVAVDSSGDIFVADSGSGSVKEIVAVNNAVSASSTVNTINTFLQPTSVAVDAAGNVFLTDREYGRVEEIVASGGVVTAASAINVLDDGDFSDPAGVAVDGSGNVFVADEYHNLVRELVLSSPPSMNFPTSTTVYTLDNVDGTETMTLGNDGNTTMTISSIAPGTSSFTFANPACTSLAESATCTISSTFAPQSVGSPLVDFGSITDNSLNATNAVQAVPLSGNSTPPPAPLVTGISPNNGSPFGGTSVVISGTNFISPTAVYFGGLAGTITASSSTSITATSPVGSPGVVDITVVAQGGTSATSSADQFTYNVLSQNLGGGPSGTLTATLTITKAGTAIVPTSANVLTQGAPNLDFTFASTTCTAMAYTVGQTCTVSYTFTPQRPGIRRGAITLLDGSNNTLATAFISATGNGPQAYFPGNSTTITVGSGFSFESGIAVDSIGDVFVADLSHNAVKEIVAVGGAVSSTSTVNTLGSGSFSQPASVAVDGAGNVFVADYGDSKVYEIAAVNGVVSSTSTVTALGSGFNHPQGVAIDNAGDVFVADFRNNAVKEIVAVNGVVSSTSTVNTILNVGSPDGIAVDGAGNVFVAAGVVEEIVAVNGLVSSSSTVNTVGSGFTGPAGIAIDAAGDVFVSDAPNNAVKEIMAVNGGVSSTSTVNTVASGFSSPAAMAVDGAGNVFVADAGHSAVKEILLATPPSITFPTATPFGSTDATDGTLSVTLGNNGNTAMAISSIAPSTSDFTFANAACATLAEGATCAIGATFTPQSVASPLTAYGNITDNSLNSIGTVQSVTLSGASTLKTKTIMFPQPTTPTLVNSQAVMSAVASNGDPVTYSITGGAATINSTTGAVTYTTPGMVTITANSAATSTYSAATSVSVTVNVEQSANLAWSPQTYYAHSGAAISAAALNATSTTPGTISYTATLLPSGSSTIVTSSTVLAAGSYTLTATMNPTDTTTYEPVSLAMPFTVVASSEIFMAGSGGVTPYVAGATMQNSAASGGGIGAAVDSAGNVWSVDADGNGVSIFQDNGILSNDLRGVGLNGASALAVDGASNIWIANGNGTVTELSNAGTVISMIAGSTSTAPSSIAVDLSGNVWVSNPTANTIDEIVGGAAPAQPLSTAVINGTPGVRP